MLREMRDFRTRGQALKSGQYCCQLPHVARPLHLHVPMLIFTERSALVKH